MASRFCIRIKTGALYVRLFYSLIVDDVVVKYQYPVLCVVDEH